MDLDQLHGTAYLIETVFSKLQSMPPKSTDATDWLCFRIVLHYINYDKSKKNKSIFNNTSL